MGDSLQRSANYERLRALQSQGLLDTSAVSRGVQLASAGYGSAVGLSRVAGKAALVAATVLVGPLWAVFGQAYQTGADPWNLFALWAALTVPWVVGARFALLWLIWIAIADTALVLFWDQTVPRSMEFRPWLALWVIHGGAWFASAWGRDRQIQWLDVPWARRLTANAALVCLVVPSAGLILERPTDSRIAALLLFLGTCGWLIRHHQASNRDLPILTAASAAAALLTTSALFQWIESADSIVIFLVLTLAIGGQVAGLARWLRSLHRAGQQSPTAQEAA